MAAIRINIEARVDKLNLAMDRLVKVTGKELGWLITQASIMFAKTAGGAMYPKGMGIPVKKRKRPMFPGSPWRLIHLEGYDESKIIGTRRGKSPVYAVYGKKRRDVTYYWQKGEAEAARPIKYRGIAKAQFWAALDRIKMGQRPRSTWAAPAAAAKASALTNVRKGFDLMRPFVHIVSSIATGSGLQPYAQVKGLGSAQRQMGAWLRRIEGKQKEAFR